MRKLIAAINVTLDGFCDHTAVIADDELHKNYNELFRNADTVLFGRVTYQLMEDSWPAIVKNPTGEKAMDEFAVLIDDIQKVVFSHTLKEVHWKNTSLVKESLHDEILRLKQQAGKNILVGSPSLIVQLLKLDLVDEYQLCVNPIILGTGLKLFKNIEERVDLKLTGSQPFQSGVVLLCYQRK
jgi:dihydrofolate reductase